ncbi:MAG: fascin domain-containing protein [Thermodesulfobacteriota bacterium]
MKKKLILLLALLLVIPGGASARESMDLEKCSLSASVYNDGSGDNRTKKRGGNYAAVPLKSLESGQVLKIVPVSGTYKYITLHARYKDGSWRTIYKGSKTEFPVDSYFKNYKKDNNSTHINISVNGAHEKYEPVACIAQIKVCEISSPPSDTSEKSGCRKLGAVYTTGTGDNKTKKKGGNYAAVPIEKLKSGQTLKINPVSGTYKYITLHARYKGGYWKTIYKGSEKEFPVDSYFNKYKNDNNCTHVNISVNGAHEKYESVPSTADILLCGNASVPVSKKTDKIRKAAFKTYQGHYLTAKNGGGENLYATSSEIGPEQIFIIEPQKGGDKIALKSSGGYYVSADGKNLVVKSPRAGSRENFKLIKFEDENKVALQAHTEKYVSAVNGGGSAVVAEYYSVNAWSKFKMIEID